MPDKKAPPQPSPKGRERQKLTDNNSAGFLIIQSISFSEARKIFLIVIGLILIGILSVYFSPSEFLFQLLGINSVNGCPLLTFMGIPCPFCGMGRVFSCALDLYIVQSFYYNPLGLISYILFGGALIYILILAVTKKKIVFKKAANKLIWFPVGFFILMWILNILYGHHF